MAKKKSTKKAGKKPGKKKKAARAKPAPKVAHAPKRRRRAPRIKAIKGPLQLGLPLQMPLALGVEAFAERAPEPVVDEAEAETETKPAKPEGEQKALFE